MDRSYILLYEFTVLLHFLWILFLMFGSLLGIKLKYVKYLHISGLVFAVSIQVLSYPCPLTYVENFFRKKANLPTYEGGFISYYLEKIIYIEIEQYIIFSATLILVLAHTFIYIKFGKEKR